MSTENLERISNGHGSTARTGGELEVPWTERRSREAEGRTARVSTVQNLNNAWATVYDPGSAVATWTEICTADNACSHRLSVSDAITDRYRKMEKRVEEQDRTIAELKGIIENLQDIVYRQKLDKEAETLVL